MTEKREEVRFNGQIVDPDTVITIIDGLIGFSDNTRYIVTELEGEDSTTFKWLQSLDNHDIGFLISEPELFFPDYTADIVRDELEDLQFKKNDEKVLLVIMNFNRAEQFLAANLRSPIIINSRTKLGKQIILSESNYSTREYVFKKD